MLVGDYLYGDSEDRGIPFCAELMTGDVKWTNRGPGSGSAPCVAADGCIYFRFADGTVALVKATPKAFRSWASSKHPAAASGRAGHTRSLSAASCIFARVTGYFVTTCGRGERLATLRRSVMTGKRFCEASLNDAKRRFAARAGRTMATWAGVKSVFLATGHQLFWSSDPVRRIGGQMLDEISVGGLQVVIGQRRKQVVQGVVADRERKQQPSEEVAARVVARIVNMVVQLKGLSIGLEVMIGQQPQLIEGEHAQGE